MNIKTEYNIWCMEYAAWDDDNYEPGLPIGYGKTEQDAINDLKQNNMIEKEITQTQQEQPTFGMKLVGITFNPSGDIKVNRAKQLCAELADIIMQEEIDRGSSGDYLYNLIKGNALREILNAQMNVVKLLTLKY